HRSIFHHRLQFIRPNSFENGCYHWNANAKNVCFNNCIVRNPMVWGSAHRTKIYWDNNGCIQYFYRSHKPGYGFSVQTAKKFKLEIPGTSGTNLSHFRHIGQPLPDWSEVRYLIWHGYRIHYQLIFHSWHIG